MYAITTFLLQSIHAATLSWVFDNNNAALSVPHGCTYHIKVRVDGVDPEHPETLSLSANHGNAGISETAPPDGYELGFTFNTVNMGGSDTLTITAQYGAESLVLDVAVIRVESIQASSSTIRAGQNVSFIATLTPLDDQNCLAFHAPVPVEYGWVNTEMGITKRVANVQLPAGVHSVYALILTPDGCGKGLTFNNDGDDDWRCAVIRSVDVQLVAVPKHSSLGSRICINAQNQYASAVFRCRVLPIGSTATITVSSGQGAQNTSATVVDLQEVDVFADGSGQTGTYTISIRHNELASAVESSGPHHIFKFVLNREQPVIAQAIQKIWPMDPNGGPTLFQGKTESLHEEYFYPATEPADCFVGNLNVSVVYAARYKFEYELKRLNNWVPYLNLLSFSLSLGNKWGNVGVNLSIPRLPEGCGVGAFVNVRIKKPGENGEIISDVHESTINEGVPIGTLGLANSSYLYAAVQSAMSFALPVTDNNNKATAALGRLVAAAVTLEGRVTSASAKLLSDDPNSNEDYDPKFTNIMYNIPDEQ